MATTPVKPAVTPAPTPIPPADTDPFADAFENLSALKDDASSIAIDAVLKGQEHPQAGPTGPTGAVAPTDGVTGPTGVIETGPTGSEDALAVAAAAVGETLELGPTGPTGAAAPSGGVTGPTGAVPAGVDAKTFNELIATLKGAVTPPQDQQIQQPQPIPLTEEETEAINTFITEFPQVAAAHQIITKRQIEAAVNYVLAEVASVLQPIAQQLNTVAQRSHLGDLEHVVPDYADVRQKVLDWVETQPDYLRTAFHSVIQQGTVDQVKDLIDRYRVSTGVVVQPAPTGGTQTAVTELTPAAKKAAAGLAQVSSKRSTATASTPTDFDGAFESFAKLE